MRWQQLALNASWCASMHDVWDKSGRSRGTSAFNKQTHTTLLSSPSTHVCMYVERRSNCHLKTRFPQPTGLPASEVNAYVHTYMCAVAHSVLKTVSFFSPRLACCCSPRKHKVWRTSKRTTYVANWRRESTRQVNFPTFYLVHSLLLFLASAARGKTKENMQIT